MPNHVRAKRDTERWSESLIKNILDRIVRAFETYQMMNNEMIFDSN